MDRDGTVYLNNAATTFPKPPQVLDAMVRAWRCPPENGFRSSAFSGGKDVLTACRENLCRLLGIADTERLFLAGGATDALNRVFGGLDLRDKPVIITQTEHNSVLRPLYNNETTSANVHVVPCDAHGYVGQAALAQVLSSLFGDSGEPGRRAVCLDGYRKRGSSEDAGKPVKGLVVVNHCSNVTGAIQPVRLLSDVAHRYDCLFMLDASQSAGCLPVMTDQWNVDILAFTGHKSLFGPTGTGGYYVRRNIVFKPLMYGGTGRNSSVITYDAGDYEYEVGTQNAVAFAGLNAGVLYVMARGIDSIAEKERSRMRRIYSALSSRPDVTVYAGDDGDSRGPLLSFNINGMKPQDAAYILYNAYGITLRTGLHCSPLIHKALGTQPYGTLRVSVSDLTADSDIDCFLAAVDDIAKACRR